MNDKLQLVKSVRSLKDVVIVPRSLCLCMRCNRTPIRTSECPTCLRVLLEETIEARDRLRAPNVLHTRFSVRFDWKDRLRLLFHGEARVAIITETEHAAGKVKSSPLVTVRPLIRRAPVAELAAAIEGKP